MYRNVHQQNHIQSLLYKLHIKRVNRHLQYIKRVSRNHTDGNNCAHFIAAFVHQQKSFSSPRALKEKLEKNRHIHHAFNCARNQQSSASHSVTTCSCLLASFFFFSLFSIQRKQRFDQYHVNNLAVNTPKTMSCQYVENNVLSIRRKQCLVNTSKTMSCQYNKNSVIAA